MTVLRAVLPAILGVSLAACGAGAAPADPAPQPTATAQVTSPPVTAVPAVTPEPTTNAPTPEPTPAPPPPKPTGVKFVDDERECVEGNDDDDDGCLRAKYTQWVLWKAPRTKGVEIRVFGVTECLAIPEHPKPGANGPCLVKGTNLPSSVRTLLARAPASAGWVSWSWTVEGDEGCDIYYPVGTAPDGRTYDAVVVQAFSETDRSTFTIAEPGWWSEPDPESGDMIC